MSRSKPTVSVLMPVYNAGQYLPAAIDSILRQTYQDFELVAVDDGSTDDSLAVLRRYQAGDNRLQVVSRPNTGIVGALNDGIAVARGRWVARMDADDISAPRRFELQLKLLDHDAELVAVGTGTRLMSSDGRVGRRLIVPQQHQDIEAEMLLGNACAIVHATMMVRADALRESGGYRQHAKNIFEELDLYFRLLQCGRFANVMNVLYFYRQLPGSNTAAHRVDRDRGRDAAMAILAEEYARRGLVFPPDWDRERARRDPLGTCIQSGWNQLKAGKRWEALATSGRALAMRPWEERAWRLFACAVRGH